MQAKDRRKERKKNNDFHVLSTAIENANSKKKHKKTG